jgi:hypothetical protein
MVVAHVATRRASPHHKPQYAQRAGGQPPHGLVTPAPAGPRSASQDPSA